jgi:hypothetical protein
MMNRDGLLRVNQLPLDSACDYETDLGKTKDDVKRI